MGLPHRITESQHEKALKQTFSITSKTLTHKGKLTETMIEIYKLKLSKAKNLTPTITEDREANLLETFVRLRRSVFNHRIPKLETQLFNAVHSFNFFSKLYERKRRALIACTSENKIFKFHEKYFGLESLLRQEQVDLEFVKQELEIANQSQLQIYIEQSMLEL